MSIRTWKGGGGSRKFAASHWLLLKFKFKMTPSLWLLLFTFLCHVTKISVAEEPPVPDDCTSRPFEDGLELECTLSAINSADEKTNFSVVPSENTLSLIGNKDKFLKYLCNDHVLMFTIFVDSQMS